MTEITGAKLTIRKKPFRILFLALMGTAALGSLTPMAYAETGGEPKIEDGTPKDLPVTLSGSYLSGRLAGVEKDFSQAAAFYEEALAADPTNPVLLERTFLLKLANGDIEDAARYAGNLEKLGSRNFLGQLTLAAEAMRNGSYDDAVALLDSTAGGPLADLSIGIAKGWAQYGAGDVDQALATIAALKGPDWFEVFKADHSALILLAAGRNDEALEQIQIAYKADQGAIRVVDAYARILAANGKKDEALKALEDYDRLLKGHPLLTQTRDLIESGAPIAPIVSVPAEGMSEILYGLGAAIGRDSAEELATAFLQLSLYLDPKAQFAAVSLGGLLERMGQPERAIEVLKMVPEDAALKRDAEIQIGLNYNSMDRVDEARKHLSALIEQDPTELEAIVSLGNVLRGHKIFDEAEAVYTKGIDSLDGNLQKEHWLLLYFRGICRERQDKWDLAEADFREALELFEDQPLVLNYLGYSLVDQGLKLDEALGMIKKAVKLRPTDGYIVDSLGWVYYRLGKYEEAVKELERAIELRPSDPVINDHLGDAYWKVGRKNEARFQWNHARDLGPEPENLPKILKKIASGLDDAQADEAKADGNKNGG
ncbi:tetratricopeptide repeat protein [uncultured Roseibium sp.]|uniref:tetratricopeptide repeat protein n=1 Tax=uncultured Roseibium sp. TaxID=1936171 RepID=UPI003216BA94